jgi:excisionase family DNA binding protein
MKRCDPEWLSVREVADLLSVDPRQVRKWLREGQFDTYAVLSERGTRIARSAYDRFVQKMRAA